MVARADEWDNSLVVAMSRSGAGESPRSVLGEAFALLGCLRGLGTARVSDVQRACGLPRTTVSRLLLQLQQVGAVERADGRWRLGPTVMELGSEIPAEPRLRAVAQRPLVELAKATGGLVALSVDVAGRGLVVDVLPGNHPVAVEPRPGMMLSQDGLAAPGLRAGRLAAIRAHIQAHAGDMRPVIDHGGADPRVNCVAAPLRLSRSDTGAVWLMMPAEQGIAAHVVSATRRTAGRIATELSKPTAS